MVLTFEQAKFQLVRNGHDCAPSNLPGHILASCEACIDGEAYTLWEDVPMTWQDLRNWMGY